MRGHSAVVVGDLVGMELHVGFRWTNRLGVVGI
jgi:hypothetical protein